MKRTLLALTSLMSISAYAGLDPVSGTRFDDVKQQIKTISAIEPVAIYDIGKINPAQRPIVVPGLGYEIPLSYASFVVDQRVAITQHNQAYVVTSEGDSNWLCMTQNEPFNRCYEILTYPKGNGWGAVAARSMWGAKQTKQ